MFTLFVCCLEYLHTKKLTNKKNVKIGIPLVSSQEITITLKQHRQPSKFSGRIVLNLKDSLSPSSVQTFL